MVLCLKYYYFPSFKYSFFKIYKLWGYLCFYPGNKKKTNIMELTNDKSGLAVRATEVTSSNTKSRAIAAQKVEQCKKVFLGICF
jgi:hypothetical protein